MGTCLRPSHCNCLQLPGIAAFIRGRESWISGRPSLQLCRRRPQPRTQCLLFVSSIAETLEAAKSAADLALELLEWPKVLQIVSSFAGTPSAKELVQGFSIPCTQVECEDLLSQTSTAIDLLAHLGSTLDFGGIPTKTVESCLSRLQKGFVISGTEGVAIASLLQFTNTIRHDIKTGADEIIQPNNALSSFIDTICNLGIQADLLKIIWKVVNEDGSVKDSASSELQKARIQQCTLEEKVQALLSSMLREQGGDASTHEVEGRFCIAVSSDYEKSPPGLLLRSGGSTSYIEPVAIVPLNDKLAEARASVLRAEYEALRALTNKVLPHVDNISILLDKIIHLDMIVARAKFSLMYKGSKPVFTVPQGAVGSSAEVEREKIRTLLPEMNPGQGVLLQLRQAYHPLLLHQYRQYTRDQKRISFGKKKRVGTTKSLQPVPIDVNVPEHVKVITITGPNTGGKTAAMKTVGLAALMAKSGLYVLAADPVYLPWFDAVFADIGDEQSLSQSLSTFSGHLRRINHIKESCTGESLVLLDEVGTGTNPTEGAALGMSILESFSREEAGGARLTFASTHHAELKTLKYSDFRFENASVEFDEETLKPTYRLLWGIPGRSNALNISERLGFPDHILQAAREHLGIASAEINQVIMDLEQFKKTFENTLFEAEQYLKKSKLLHSSLQQAVQHLEDDLQTQYLTSTSMLQEEAHKARSLLGAIHQKKISAVSSSVNSTSPEGKLAGLETRGDKASLSNVLQVPSAGESSLPKVGQKVYVPRLGKEAQVVQVLSGKKMLLVQSGALQLRLSYSDVQLL